MKFNIPDFMAETSRSVELTLNLEVSPEDYSAAVDKMVAYALFREGKGESPSFIELCKAISDVILFDGRKLTDDQFMGLIHGEWSTLSHFCIYLAQVMVRIGEYAAKQPTVATGTDHPGNS